MCVYTWHYHRLKLALEAICCSRSSQQRASTCCWRQGSHRGQALPWLSHWDPRGDSSSALLGPGRLTLIWSVNKSCRQRWSPENGAISLESTCGTTGAVGAPPPDTSISSALWPEPGGISDDAQPAGCYFCLFSSVCSKTKARCWADAPAWYSRLTGNHLSFHLRFVNI